MSGAISWQLYHAQYQWLNAVAATLLGTALLFCGEVIFRWLLVWITAVFVGMIATGEITMAWDLELRNSLRYVVGAQAGLLASYIAWRSFEGVAALFSVIVGAVVAGCVRPLLANYGGLGALMANQWVVVIFYTIIILFFLALADCRVRSMWLPIVSPFIGGALFSSGISFGLTELAVNGCMIWLFGELHAVAAPWVDFLSLLCDVHGKDVGLFASSPHNLVVWGQESSLDRMLGSLCWFLLFVVGAIVQCRARRHRSLRKAGDGDCSRFSDPDQ
jgi:hypothetical protein